MTEWHNGIAKITLPTPFPVGDVNVYLVRGERLTLVDVGPNTDEAFLVLSQELQTLGLKPSDIEQVVLTHHHPDHAGLLDRFSPELEVYGHVYNERWLNRTDDFFTDYDEFFKKLFHEFGIPQGYFRLINALKKTLKYSCNRSLTGFLKEGDTPVGLSEWKVIETPGHAQSQISLFRQRDGVFIAGDHLLAHISPNPLLEPPLPGEMERPKPQLQYNASLRKVLQYSIRLVYSGHGEEIEEIPELIEKRLAKQHDRAQLVKTWLKSESLTAFEVCQRLFPKVYERELSLTISETVAQLDYLVDLEEIKIIDNDGVYFYKAN